MLRPFEILKQSITVGVKYPDLKDKMNELIDELDGELTAENYDPGDEVMFKAAELENELNATDESEGDVEVQ